MSLETLAQRACQRTPVCLEHCLLERQRPVPLGLKVFEGEGASAEMDLDDDALERKLFSDERFEDVATLPTEFDLWLAQKDTALKEALGLLGLDTSLCPLTAPIIVCSASETSFHPIPWPTPRWPMEVPSLSYSLSLREAVSLVATGANKGKDGQALLARLTREVLPDGPMIIIWPLQVDILDSGNQAENSSSKLPWPFQSRTFGIGFGSDENVGGMVDLAKGVRRTCWFESSTGAVAGMELRCRLTVGEGLPGGGARLVVLKAHKVVQQAGKGDHSGPMEALEKMLSRFNQPGTRPWVIVVL